MEFMRLHPDPAVATLGEVRDALQFTPPADRPYVIANLIASADGRAAFRGRSGPLSDAGDRALFHALRERVDAVMVGTRTLRSERYGRLIRDPAARRRRGERGLAPEPLACVVTRTGNVPLDIPLFTSGRVLVFAPRRLDAVRTVVLDAAELTPAAVLRRLREQYAVRSLLCEGGPTLFGSLLHARVVDELFLTLAPRLAGGGCAPTIASGEELTEPAQLRLRCVLERAGTLFLRFALCAPAM